MTHHKISKRFFSTKYIISIPWTLISKLYFDYTLDIKILLLTGNWTRISYCTCLTPKYVNTQLKPKVHVRTSNGFSLSLPSFLPSPFLTCCATLPILFGRKRPHLQRWLIAQPLHQTVSKLRSSGVFLSCKANARRSVHSTGIISLSPLSLATDLIDVTLGAFG